MTVNGDTLGGHQRMALLAKIGECGSITRAAKALQISYKAAWDAVDAMNNLAGEPLVERLAGGKGGGGTRLTLRGEQLVANYRIIEQEHRKFIALLGQRAHNLASDYALFRGMAMKTSARNQFLGTVTQVTSGAVQDEVELEVAGGNKIVATISHQSAKDLDLSMGKQALALVKASSIVLVTHDEGARFSARNRLTGEVARIEPGAVNAEVVVALPGGATVVATVTLDSCEGLGLAVGKTVSAIFKASSVIVATPV